MTSGLLTTEGTVSLTINNFSKLKLNKRILSSPYYINNLLWKIVLEPYSNCGLKTLGFFVQCYDGSKSETWACDAVAELRVKSYISGQDSFAREFLVKRQFCAERSSWGFVNFMFWSEITDSQKGFIQNDTVKFEAKIVADRPKDEILSSEKSSSLTVTGKDSNSEEEEFSQLLARFKLDNYFSFLKESEVNLSNIEYLTEKDICEIFGKLIGVRAQFRAFLNDYRKSINLPLLDAHAC